MQELRWIISILVILKKIYVSKIYVDYAIDRGSTHFSYSSKFVTFVTLL